MNALWVAPVMPDYDSARATFPWHRERSRLAGLPGSGLNMGYEAVDRNLLDGHGEHVALRLVARDGSVRNATYDQLARDSSRFAHVLDSLGIGPGERVFTLLGRRYELYTVVLGTLRAGRVLCPLFTAFGPEPVALRMLAVQRVVPDADFTGLDADVPLRDTFDMDSVDFLEFVEALAELSGRELSEDDYPALDTWNGCAARLTAREPEYRLQSR
ncbi:AMP-binding protein [Streptomyces sp. NPDC048338]|uniref:AMP-binding protein n=1 Tax=Streptomyces sp. NPDC048338 TaxID=3365536 RepID=UPI00371F51E0